MYFLAQFCSEKAEKNSEKYLIYVTDIYNMEFLKKLLQIKKKLLKIIGHFMDNNI